jgi:hypothetical protein
VARLIKKASHLKKNQALHDTNGFEQLVQFIKRTETLNELSSTLQPYLSNMDMVPTTAALVRLAKLTTRNPTYSLSTKDATAAVSIFKALLLQLRGNLSALDAQGVCNAIWSLSKLYAIPTIHFIEAADLELLLAQLLKEAAGMVADMNGQNMSNLLVAVANLNMPKRLYGRQLGPALQNGQRIRAARHGGAPPPAAAKNLKSVNRLLQKADRKCNTDPVQQQRSHKDSLPQEAPSPVKALVPPSLIQPLLEGSALKLYMYNGQALSNIAWALARLGCKPTTAWQLAFLQQTARRMWELEPCEVANMTWALVRLGMRPEKEWEDRLLTMTQSRLAR